GEGDVVAVVQVVEEDAGGAGDELDGTLGQDARLDHEAHAPGGDVAGGSRRLHQGGHARDEGGGELLQHAPDGEVEGVDLHRDAGHRGVDVGAQDARVAGEDLGGAVHDDVPVGQLAAALGGVGEQGG